MTLCPARVCVRPRQYSVASRFPHDSSCFDRSTPVTPSVASLTEVARTVSHISGPYTQHFTAHQERPKQQPHVGREHCKRPTCLCLNSRQGQYPTASSPLGTGQLRLASLLFAIPVLFGFLRLAIGVLETVQLGSLLGIVSVAQAISSGEASDEVETQQSSASHLEEQVLDAAEPPLPSTDSVVAAITKSLLDLWHLAVQSQVDLLNIQLWLDDNVFGRLLVGALALLPVWPYLWSIRRGVRKLSSVAVLGTRHFGTNTHNSNESVQKADTPASSASAAFVITQGATALCSITALTWSPFYYSTLPLPLVIASFFMTFILTTASAVYLWQAWQPDAQLVFGENQGSFLTQVSVLVATAGVLDAVMSYLQAASLSPAFAPVIASRTGVMQTILKLVKSTWLFSRAMQLAVPIPWLIFSAGNLQRLLSCIAATVLLWLGHIYRTFPV